MPFFRSPYKLIPPLLAFKVPLFYLFLFTHLALRQKLKTIQTFSKKLIFWLFRSLQMIGRKWAVIIIMMRRCPCRPIVFNAMHSTVSVKFGDFNWNGLSLKLAKKCISEIKVNTKSLTTSASIYSRILHSKYSSS